MGRWDTIGEAIAILSKSLQYSRGNGGLIAEVYSDNTLKRDPSIVGGNKQIPGKNPFARSSWKSQEEVDRYMDMAQQYLYGPYGE